MNGTKTLDKSVGAKEYFVYGLGNFASQLSWMMVSTYLSVFYTDVFGLTPAAVAMLMLVAKIWDGINDPMMGTLMERTHTKWGRFRPYIFLGAPLLVVFTVLTFTVPGFGNGAKLVYAYVTYIFLGMSYTMTNVPYLALPAVMTSEPEKVNRLMTAQMIGMTVGQILLNLFCLPLVQYFGKGDQAAGYHTTAIVFALIALPIFWAVAYLCKERITVSKEKQGSISNGLKLVFTNKNLVCAIFYAIFNMTGMLGRIAVAVYFFINCIGPAVFTPIFKLGPIEFNFVTLFMMMQMIVGTIIMPFSPKVIEKIGVRKTAIISMFIQGGALVLLALGPYQQLWFTTVSMIIYGLGYIAGPCGSVMMIDAIDDFEDKYGYRNDGMAFSFQGLGTKIGSAIGNAVCLALIGAFGYYGGVEMTPKIQQGINISVNIVPALFYFIGLIPLFMYQLDKPGYMDGVRARLAEKRAKAAPEKPSDK